MTANELMPIWWTLQQKLDPAVYQLLLQDMKNVLDKYRDSLPFGFDKNGDLKGENNASIL